MCIRDSGGGVSRQASGGTEGLWRAGCGLEPDGGALLGTETRRWAMMCCIGKSEVVSGVDFILEEKALRRECGGMGLDGQIDRAPGRLGLS